MDAETEEVIWHDVENGSYEADLGLWRDLSAAAGGPILELGCGTGRVALHLAAHGHHVMGIDREPELVEALRARASEQKLDASAEVDDLVSFEVRGRFGLVAAPMQVLQLLPGSDERRRALNCVRHSLAPRGLAALAIVEGDLGAAAPGFELGGVLPDVREHSGWVYSSLPIELCRDGDSLVVSRLRQVVAPDGDLTEERHSLSLTILDAATVEAEAAEVGLKPAGCSRIPATDAHVGSCVVLLEAAQ